MVRGTSSNRIGGRDAGVGISTTAGTVARQGSLPRSPSFGQDGQAASMALSVGPVRMAIDQPALQLTDS